MSSDLIPNVLGDGPVKSDAVREEQAAFDIVPDREHATRHSRQVFPAPRKDGTQRCGYSRNGEEPD